MDYVPITERNRARVNAFIGARWFSLAMAVRGQIVDMTKAEGILALENGEIAGLVTYFIRGDAMEITSLDSLREGRGVGTALLERAVAAAREKGLKRVALVTTNDNVDALRFYQKRGFDMARLYRNALDVSRRLKPEIPLVGEHGIPLRHEIEFEMIL
ncbi:MAG TPA: GNAT family N-acetyltransferase [Clostridia bacterium]|nr:GNAT family N-acetyltransferase [Clostridia bacterium]HOS17811.1 GNAT family N-acetyltransferase [Clostridia bacterium]HPK14836.1 GNAT family N-acetyltransferase [Clostridia bacterium]